MLNTKVNLMNFFFLFQLVCENDTLDMFCRTNYKNDFNSSSDICFYEIDHMTSYLLIGFFCFHKLFYGFPIIDFTSDFVKGKNKPKMWPLIFKVHVFKNVIPYLKIKHLQHTSGFL